MGYRKIYYYIRHYYTYTLYQCVSSISLVYLWNQFLIDNFTIIKVFLAIITDISSSISNALPFIKTTDTTNYRY